jgi:hypothetical protein
MSAALSRASDSYPTVVGVALSGGLVPDERVLRLVDGVGRGTTLPMFVVETDSFETAVRAAHIEGSITPDNTRKVEAALGLFEAHIDVAALARARRARPGRHRHADHVPVRPDRASAGGRRPHRAARGCRGSGPDRRRPGAAAARL